MRKWLSMLLMLALLAMPVTACAAGAEAGAALPAIGDVVNGFELIETREFRLLNATIYRFTHQRTGAELFYLANADNNRLFDLTFKTQAVDNTGLPHVFEHATLDGSEKYPSKSLFFNLSYQTYNTLMNAYTYQNMTTYPVASLSEAQLLKLADFYTDSCLCPMLMDDESIYREEAWRYRLDQPDADLTIEGTVYSEMLGSLTLEQMSYYNARRVSLPGSRVGNVSGGDPAFIPDMTYETLCAYHDKYYHPSNCVAYLYGRFDDYAAFLKLLDDAFALYERREFAREDPDYTPIAEPVDAEFTFPVEAGSNVSNAAAAVYTYVCPGLKDDKEQLFLMRGLCNLLNSNASPLCQIMERELPGCVYGCIVDMDGPDAQLLFIIQRANPEDVARFREIIDDIMADIAENGFSQDMVDSVMANLELSDRLATESSALGADYVPVLAEQYITSGNPYQYLDYLDTISSLADWNREGRYSEVVRRWVLDNPRHTLVTTRPEPGAKEARDAELAAKLADIKAGMSDDEIAAIVNASSADADADDADAAAMVSSLQAVDVASLPEEYQTCPVSDVTDEDGIRRIEATASVDGYGSVSLLFDARGLPQEDIHWFHLYLSLLGELDTEAHTAEELDMLANRYLYSYSTRLSVARVDDEYFPRMRLEWIALDEDLAHGYDLMYELVYHTRFDDIQRILDMIKTFRTGLKTNITRSPISIILARSLAVTSPAIRYSDYYNNLDYYAFLSEAERLFSEDPEAAVARLTAIRDYFNNANGAIAAYAGSEAGIALNRPLADAYLAKLDNRPIEPVAYDLPVPAKREALIVDSAVQYNMVSQGYEGLDLVPDDVEADIDVVTQLVNDIFLLPQLRDQYGAYGVTNEAMDYDGMYIASYRDPNIAQTFEVYDQLPDMIAGMQLDQDTLNGYILSTYTEYAMPSGQLALAGNAINLCLEGGSQEDVLESMRSLKALTPEKAMAYADVYRKLCEGGQRATAGGAAAINANADLFDAILNPFAAEALTGDTFPDVTEDLEAYDAIAYVYDNGLMAPLADGRFGVDEPATVGDLAYALFCLTASEDFTAEDAVAALSQYGILWDDASPDEALGGESCDAVLETFAYMADMDYPGGMVADANPLNRAQLAQSLAAFVQLMETAMSQAS